ncbi:YciI family protein [Paenibacillus sp. 1P07SE]|uniref:YciI family protein n=1 Tax=Paenibacillus sp. 1P07SE TaxID=3132209 RepID=UPI0039A71E5F
MKTFMMIYRGGEVPEAEREDNIAALWSWLDGIREGGHEKVRFAGEGRVTVARDEVQPYKGDVFGMSLIEADSLEAAISLTADWPELPYGGKIDILEAL